MTVRIYRSSDTSAPALSGTAGSLTTVLDAVLVNGYGSQAAAGWTIEFTTTNARAYRMSTSGTALGYYLRVNDSGAALGGDETAGTPTVKEARLRGYEAMTAVSVGTNAFPTTAQSSIFGLIARKSTTADSVSRPWIILADQRTFYMFVLTGDTAGSYYCWGFGESYSLRSSDAGRVIIVARNLENSALSSSEPLGQISSTMGTSGILGSGTRYFNRSVSGTLSATSATSNVGDPAVNSANTIDFTNAADNKVYTTPIRLTENSATSTGTWRGRYRGLWFWPHTLASAADGDTFIGANDLAGRSFTALKAPINTSGYTGVILLETSNTWDTN